MTEHDLTADIRPTARCAWLLVVVAGCAIEPSPTTAERTSAERTVPRVAPGGHALAERAQIAASGRYAAAAGRRMAVPAVATSWSDALDVPAVEVVGATLTGPAQAAAVIGSLGIIRPLRGNSFVLLSTGIAGTAAPEPGTDFAPAGTAGDLVSLQLDLQLPPGAAKMSLHYNFLSAESPDFIGTAFNDTFAIRVIDSSGTRDLTVASVNSSSFFPASASRAAGTGFDILTEDPSGVDTVFGPVGDPDAGLTDFQLFTTDLTSGGTVQVVFTIQDNGDGILDSAVLLDALTFSSIETIDPRTGDPTSDLISKTQNDGSLTRNVDALVTGGRTIVGAVADGATEILLRVKVPGPGVVNLSLPGGSPSDGGLRSLDGTGLQAAVPIRTVPTASGDYALALYRVPADFNRDADDQLVERSIQIQGAYVADSGAAFDTQVDFKIKRPPVVMAHGLWSDLLAWQSLPLLHDPRFVVSYANYAYSCNPQVNVLPPSKTTCPSPPADKTLVCGPDPGSAISLAIRAALDNARRGDIAATRVDLVAHGAGGLHARQYIDRDGYRNADNFGQGDINRLITINTPHFGSAVATAMVSARDQLSGADRDTFVCNARATARTPIEHGDIDALVRENIHFKATGVPGHAIIGTGGGALDRATSIAKLATVSREYVQTELKLPQFRIFPLPGAPKPSDAFGRCDHDLFSDIVSQAGGLTGAATSPLAIAPSIPDKSNVNAYSDTDYFYSMKDPGVSDEIVALLNGAVQGPSFAAFPESFQQRCDKATGIATASLAQLAGQAAAPAPADASLDIVSPAQGTAVVAGELIEVAVAPSDGFVPQTVLVIAAGSVERTDTPPFTVSLRVPRDALGPLQLFAIALAADGNVVLSDDVTLDVTTTATISSVSIITQDPILFGTSARQPLVVVGHYSDGATRDITLGITGTSYRTTNPAIATVSADGVLTAVAPGIVTVAAQNGNTQDSVTVTVKPNAAPVANAGPAVALACIAPGSLVPVQLDGSQSFDLDGDPLHFTWSEAGSPIASGSAPVALLGAGVHAIDLEVSDGASTSHAAVTVAITEDLEPPILAVRGADPATAECGEPYIDEGASALDACDGELDGAVETASSVDPGLPGSYRVDYQVHDQAGFVATASRSVQVVDRTAPAISLLGANPQTVECRTAFRDDGARAMDACSGDLTANISRASNVRVNVPGSYAVQYRVSDGAGLAAMAQRSVVVADRTAPLVLTAPLIELFPADDQYRELTLAECALAVDTCSGLLDVDRAGQITAIYSDEPITRRGDPRSDIVIIGPSAFKLRQRLERRSNGRVYEIEFTVRDASGNTTAAHSCFVGVKATRNSPRPVDDGRVVTVRP
jgi:hypothetical protein